MKNFQAFLLGMIEFRSDFTTNCGDADDAYDRGRELAHRITLRRFDHA